jgi:hypothetical protein
MNLSTHFTVEELTFSSTAVRLGIDNTPLPGIYPNLDVLALGLERVRTLLSDNPLHIDSGYRCRPLNDAVHGAANSAHMTGYAADFVCAAFGLPVDIVETIQASDIQFDQLIQEGTWVHISFDPRMRREVLTAHFVNGDPATYTRGA